ncbi:hypothetical protein OF117_12540 [Geodermatophilus sp. YIM 151500]|uniref:hypothetical protein n=1 Tax=Geodermatophilus sp. YIM 151500 TaxID=2984531 RepID=UPI0021E4E100|nr:hypothetical protein [Geodermatophilus sp. YIM 151500]MCV2490192.1 hypothetical protein [Geodermatophilus sp. YIM 151500]
MTEPEATGYEQPPDEKPADGAPGRRPTAGAGEGGSPLTTDADAQRDDLPVRPGNEGA